MEDAIIGRSVGPYRVLEKLGEGGMGMVYRAEDTRLGRHVALKVFPPHLASDVVRLSRFQREARAIAALNHPNIVTLYSIEEADGVRFMTMELVEGRTLAELIWDGLAFDEVLEMALALADALAAAHAHGITHRDLKPSNVMVTAEGRPKVLDFGAAKFHGFSGPMGSGPEHLGMGKPLTLDGVPIGTLPYMSPEQLEGSEVDSRSDIFSLCILIYEMATGTRPFRGGNLGELSSSILHRTPTTVTLHRVDLPEALDRILQRGLEKRWEDRYSSVLELKADLEALAGSTSKRVPWSRFVPWPWKSGFGLAAAVFAVVLVVALLNFPPERLDPQWPSLVPHVADVHVTDGRITKARRLLMSVEEGARVEGWFQVMAKVHHQSGEHAEELLVARRVREKNRQDPLLALLELRALAALGRSDEIREVLSDLLSGSSEPRFDRSVPIPHGSAAGSIALITADELMAHGHPEAANQLYGDVAESLLRFATDEDEVAE